MPDNSDSRIHNLRKRGVFYVLFCLFILNLSSVYAQETTVPELVSLSFDETSVDASSSDQTITLTAVFNDENTLTSDTFYLESLLDGSQVAFAQQGTWSTSDQQHTAIYTATIETNNTEGIWYLSGLVVTDSESNANTSFDTLEELILANYNPFVSVKTNAGSGEFDASVTANDAITQTGDTQQSSINITLQDAVEYEIWFVGQSGTDFNDISFSGSISVAQACSIFGEFATCLVTASNNNAAFTINIETETSDIENFGYSVLVQATASSLEADWLDNYVVFPPEDFDNDGISNEQDLDDDGDGVNDNEDEFPYDASESADFDQDGIGDNADTDDDNDGVEDEFDDFPFDDSEYNDNDGDGLGDISDTDDDNDGVIDSNDAFPFDDSEYADFDADGVGNNEDLDDDNDGAVDSVDAFPFDDSETVDTDGDGIGNNTDSDDDNDGTLDVIDAFPRDDSEDTDTDGDGTGDNADLDDDNDGVFDTDDAFPLDAGDSADNDQDGIGNNTDTDDDNDGVLDADDAFPFNADEYLDTDGDGIGNNSDSDDDNDGLDDQYDAFPLDSSEVADYDGDLIGNNVDTDDDNDGVLDTVDAFPFAENEWFDTDGDGIGDNADPDNDNDGVEDEFDAFDNDPSETNDFDEDGVGDNADTDDDGDGFEDDSDAFPFDNTEYLDTDNDGVGNNADTDDDGDGISDENDLFPLDSTENSDNDLDGIGNNADLDDDNDGVSDSEDVFPFDSTETADYDLDGIGDNADLDDDNDNVADADDFFPFDDSEWADNDLDGIGNNADLDDDNDGVQDTTDAFPFDATEAYDNDVDGIGNNADTDDDNDGVLDTVDAFPFSEDESIDSDGDGIGNNADTDDDNDGIVDEDDPQPLNSSIGDTTAPSISGLSDFTIEATGALTTIVLDEPTVSDDNLFGFDLTNDFSGALALGETIITWTATDFAGNQTQATQTVTVVDTTPPEFPVIDVIEVDARGYITDVASDIDVSASDLVDGTIAIDILSQTQLVSGSNSVFVSATDASNNTSISEVFIDIHPIVQLPEQLLASAGSVVSVPISLSGEAAQYPVEIEYTIVGSVSSELNGVIEIESSQSSMFDIDISPIANSSEQVFLTIASPQNAVIDNDQLIINIDNSNYAPRLSINAQQQDESVSIAYRDNGMLTLIAQINDINPEDEHQITWSPDSISLLNANVDTNTGQLDIDLSNIDAGSYLVEVQVAETNTSDAFASSLSYTLVIEDDSPVLSDLTDSDLDGLSDAAEGAFDSDGDGIVDYLDNNNASHILGSEVSEQTLTTEIGLNLRVGDAVRASNGTQTTSTVLEAFDLNAYFSDLLSSNVNTDDVHFESVQSINNFKIDDLNYVGQSVAVVLPLSSGTTIPANAQYRKFNSVEGWFTFVENDYNGVYSASFDDEGGCPQANSAAYQVGLIEGATCIQLIIEDGGPNDSDFTANGSISDPGVLAVELTNTSPNIIIDGDTSVLEGELVRIDASQTTDQQNDSLIYTWEQIAGYSIDLQEANTPLLSFVAPQVDQTTNLRFRLTVYDGRDTSSTDVLVVISNSNQAPTVSIDSHQNSVDAGTIVNMSVSASDADGDKLSYSWSQVSGPMVFINGSNSDQISFTAPQVDQSEVIVLQVVISDGVKQVSQMTQITINQLVDDTELDMAEEESGGGSLNLFYWLLLLIALYLRNKKSPEPMIWAKNCDGRIARH